MENAVFGNCPICTLSCTLNQDTVEYRNTRAHRQCVLNVESGKVQDMSAPIGQEIPITLQTLANEQARLRDELRHLGRDVESWGGSHNALATQVKEYERRAETWHLEVYQFIITLSNRIEQLERRMDYTWAATGVEKKAQELTDRVMGGITPDETAKWAARGISSEKSGQFAWTEDVESSMDSQQADLLDMYRRDRDLWKTKYHALWARFKEKGR